MNKSGILLRLAMLSAAAKDDPIGKAIRQQFMDESEQAIKDLKAKVESSTMTGKALLMKKLAELEKERDQYKVTPEDIEGMKKSAKSALESIFGDLKFEDEASKGDRPKSDDCNCAGCRFRRELGIQPTADTESVKSRPVPISDLPTELRDELADLIQGRRIVISGSDSAPAKTPSIDTLKSELAELEKTHTDLNTRNHDLRINMDNILNAGLKGAAYTIALSELERSQKEERDTISRMVELHGMIEQLTNDNDPTSELASLKSELNDLRAPISMQSSIYEKSSAKIALANTAITSAEGTIAQCKDRVKLEESKMNSSGLELTQLHSRRDTIESRIKELLTK